MLYVTDQALRLVLRRHANPPDPRIDAVGKGEINNAKLAAKRTGGFGTPIGKLTQAAPSPASQDERYRITCDMAVKTRAPPAVSRAATHEEYR